MDSTWFKKFKNMEVTRIKPFKESKPYYKSNNIQKFIGFAKYAIQKFKIINQYLTWIKPFNTTHV
jgi:hypothetical protein